MIKIKSLFCYIAMIIVILAIALNGEKIYKEFSAFFNESKKLVYPKINEYAKDDEFKFLTSVTNFKPQNYDELIDVFYTVLNNGWTDFTFYCPESYTNCLEDVSKISYDEVLLSHINNYVHPYNSYSTIKTLYDKTGEVTINITHLYNKYEIQKVDAALNQIIEENIDDDMSDTDKIRALHDYIINTTKYDTQKIETDNSPYDSSRIQGVLFDNYAICSGYTDTMAVLLNKIGIKNYKISSDTHVWNAVYINDEWLHLDLTWDDPVTSSNRDVVNYDYFLIKNDTLVNNDRDAIDHIFDKKVYLEYK